MKVKHLLALASVTLASLALVSCGQKEQAQEPAQDQAATQEQTQAGVQVLDQYTLKICPTAEQAQKLVADKYLTETFQNECFEYSVAYQNMDKLQSEYPEIFAEVEKAAQPLIDTIYPIDHEKAKELVEKEGTTNQEFRAASEAFLTSLFADPESFKVIDEDGETEVSALKHVPLKVELNINYEGGQGKLVSVVPNVLVTYAGNAHPVNVIPFVFTYNTETKAQELIDPAHFAISGDREKFFEEVSKVVNPPKDYYPVYTYFLEDGLHIVYQDVEETKVFTVPYDTVKPLVKPEFLATLGLAQ